MPANTVVNVDTTEITVKGAAIAEVCATHNVFPAYDAEELAFEKAAFISDVVRYAEGVRWGYLELTYRNPLVRFIIKTSVVDNVAKLLSSNAYDHPHVSTTMDYAAPNNEIRDALNK